MTLSKKTCVFAASLLVCLSISACRSAFVQSTIVNRSGGTVSLVEVDYPSASFGIQQIADGATFHYRFKIQDSGPVAVTYTGADNKVHTATGPTLNQGQQGSLVITLNGDGKVIWTSNMSASK